MVQFVSNAFDVASHFPLPLMMLELFEFRLNEGFQFIGARLSEIIEKICAPLISLVLDRKVVCVGFREVFLNRFHWVVESVRNVRRPQKASQFMHANAFAFPFFQKKASDFDERAILL